ncbi:MAG: amino acid ABC transporter ATP-binding/permease protein, partial [Nitriliruptoraceae bacterium]
GLAVAALAVPVLAAQLARRPERRLATTRGALSAELVELLAAAPELRVLGRLDAARERVGAIERQVASHDRAAIVRGGGSDALVQLTLGLTLLGLVVVGVPAVTDGRLEGVLLGSLLVLALAGAEAVGPLPPAARSLIGARRASGRLREVLEAPPPAPEPDEPAPPPQEPRLALDHVTARYPVGAIDGSPQEAAARYAVDAAAYPDDTAPALHDATLELAPGRRIAVIGRSGAGKSTLAALTVRFLDPVAGTVELGGLDLTRLRGDDVRGLVALAPQQAHLFDGPIADNLRLARPDASDEQLWAALAAARLDTWVAELADGLATPVGDAGRALSGGQRHRLVLARTLLVGAPLLVLDEPTADLDAHTGRGVLRDALVAASDRGVLLLTHDLRALPVVDEVVLLDGGRVVARGTHQQLLAAHAGYANWWRLERPTLVDPLLAAP